jgi:hypothetical protein
MRIGGNLSCCRRRTWRALRCACGSGTIDLSTSNGRIVIDDPPMGAFSFVVPAADLGTVQPGHYRVELLVFQPGNVKTVFTGSIDLAAGEKTPAQWSQS